MSNAFTKGALVASAVILGGCLPPDTRPEPGRVNITADLPAALRDSQLSDGALTFDTEDGWRVTLATLFVSVGNAGLDGTSCNEYADARYRRILDMKQPGPQKVSQIWGLNACQLSYSLGPPPAIDAVVGAGVSADERALMASAIVPVSTPTGLSTAQGMALHVIGSASDGEKTLDFDWGFADRVRFSECKRLTNGTLEDHLPLAGGQTLTLDIGVDPRELFRAHPPAAGTVVVTDSSSMPDAGSPSDAGAPTNDGASRVPSVPLMQLMADADQASGNANGHISIEELSKVMLPGEPALLSAIPGADTNLAEVLRQSSYPSVFIFADNGRCNVDVRQGGGRGGGF